jgi:transposase
MAYSMEFRVAVAKAHEESGSSDEVAEAFGCSASWVRRLIQRQRESGSLEPRPLKLPNNKKLDEPDLERLRQLIANQPDMTLAELAKELNNKVSVPTVWRATQALGLPLKKKRSMPPNKTEPMSKRRGPSGLGGSRT